MKTATKRRQKSEGHVLDHATKKLARALKEEMLKKDGRVDYERLRKEGYSERLLEKFRKA